MANFICNDCSPRVIPSKYFFTLTLNSRLLITRPTPS